MNVSANPIKSIELSGIRARLAEPDGWITLLNTENGRSPGTAFWGSMLVVWKTSVTYVLHNNLQDIHLHIVDMIRYVYSRYINIVLLSFLLLGMCTRYMDFVCI